MMLRAPNVEGADCRVINVDTMIVVGGWWGCRETFLTIIRVPMLLKWPT